MELNYKKIGKTGEALIILHGLFGMLDNWLSLGRRFAEYYQVYLIDQRNHGKSPHHNDFSYPVLASDLYDFMHQHDIEQANIIGHSMGGKTAMQFAVENEFMVNKLIVADIAPKSYPPGHEVIIEALKSVDLPQITNRQQADEALAKSIDDWRVRQFLLKNLTRSTVNKSTYQWKCNIAAIEAAYPVIIANALTPYDQFDGECLFIKGEKSKRYIKLPNDEALIQHFFPNARIAVINDAGHWVHAEQPNAFFDMSVEFLDR